MAANNPSHLRPITQPALSSEEFSVLMDGLKLPEYPRHLTVAVSGGADSMALALLAHHWATERNIALTALTVDHGLRPESSDEAAHVARWMAAQNIAHHILRWTPPEIPTANIQAAAREARYQLIGAWCAEHGVEHLLLGHHLEDQAETFLIRLGRGSGVDGLSAMQPVTPMHHLTLLRPLLSVDRSRLRGMLTHLGQDWLEDPSNQNPIYTRVKLRNLLPVLTEAGLSPQRLADTAARMQRARSFLEESETRAYSETVVSEENQTLIKREPFTKLHAEIGLRVLARVIGNRTGNTYRPRFDELERLYDAICAEKQPVARTLAGLMFRSQPDGLIRITHEKHA